MTKTISLLFLLSTKIIFAQDSLWQYYKFSDSIIINKERSGYQSISFIGNYSQSLIMEDSAFNYPNTPSTKEDSLYFSKFHPIYAIEYIISRAKKEQVLMINEAHNNPQNRLFTTKLLQKLYDEGYRYLGAETINPWDSSLNERKYPIIRSGYYTCEPMYGNMVREALKIGFTVFGYETTIFPQTEEERDKTQAQNIKKIIDKDSKAKIIIHCGYAHQSESEGLKAMAYWFTKSTGIDPFTLDQTLLRERGSPEYESAFNKIIHCNSSSVFIDSANFLFKGPEYANDYDVCVYHPRTKYINGRPNWYFDCDRSPFFITDKIKIAYPCLVFAYLAEENITIKDKFEEAIPFDIIELKNAADRKALSLKKGKYIIKIKNASAQKQTISLTN